MVQTRTNQVYRKKYFMDTTKVLFADAAEETGPRTQAPQSVLDASDVVVSDKPVSIRCAPSGDSDKIRVETVKDGSKIKSIKIVCPCGRHTQMDVQYEDI